MNTNIISNGSGQIQPIDNLVALLATEPLDPSFERFGNFYENYPEMADGSVSKVPHYFFGNFFNVSHVFGIETDDDDLASTIYAAIMKNQATDAYKAAKEARKTGFFAKFEATGSQP